MQHKNTVEQNLTLNIFCCKSQQRCQGFISERFSPTWWTWSSQYPPVNKQEKMLLSIIVPKLCCIDKYKLLLVVYKLGGICWQDLQSKHGVFSALKEQIEVLHATGWKGMQKFCYHFLVHLLSLFLLLFIHLFGYPSVIKTSSQCEGGEGGQHLQQTYFN